MTTLKLTLPETVEVEEVEEEVVTALADRLRDDHGYELTSATAGTSGSGNQYPLRPAGSIAVTANQRALTVKLHGVTADAHDLFTAVSSELEQRHDGLVVAID